MITSIGVAALAIAFKAGSGQNTQIAQSTLGLRQAIQLAEQSSSSIKAARSDYDAARAIAGEGQARRRPQLSFQGSATRYDDRTMVSLPGGKSPFEIEPDNQEQLSVVLSQDLDISGRLGMAAAQAKLDALSSAYLLEAVTEDQDLATTTAYYGVLRAQQNVQVATASLNAYKEQSGIADKLYKGGVGQKIDTLRAESQVAEAERELVRRQNEFDSARSTLNDLLSRPLDAPLILFDPAQEATDNPGEQDRPALIKQALDKRPEALAASTEVAASQKGLSIAKTGSAPEAFVSISGSRYPTTSFISPHQNIGAVTLGLSIPIFDGGLTREHVKQARAGIDLAKARQDRVLRAIALEVQNAALDVETERKRLDAANVALTAATAARRLAQQRFESQVGLYIEVTDAQSELTAAQAAEVEATYDLLTAKARLDRALSRPLVP